MIEPVLYCSQCIRSCRPFLARAGEVMRNGVCLLLEHCLVMLEFCVNSIKNASVRASLVQGVDIVMHAGGVR